MRIAFLGDIHSNHDALETVLRHVASHHPDRVVHVGDVVGYCTDFEAVIERLRADAIRGVCGNHDLMVLGQLAAKRATGAAQQAVAWTRSRLGTQVRDYLQALPRELRLEEVIVFHATPDSLEQNISRVEHARAAFQSLASRDTGWFAAVHGHTHKQRVFELKHGVVSLVHSGEGVFTLDPQAKYLISAGSVGQSRDADPRSGYVIYDSHRTVSFHRVAYDWQSCKRKLRKAGLATRLFHGDVPVRRALLRPWLSRLQQIITRRRRKSR